MSQSPSPLTSHDTLICVGSGGVGKTTIAASLALKAALSGKASLVCTIDPAKRLANALGLEALGNAETNIPPSAFEQAGLTPRAPMSAMMLDMKRSWDELIERHATAEQRDKILNNRFYQSMSTALAGSQEYIAMEKLWELRTRRTYPLVVLDTPPTVHALDFLEAPNRILDFLDNDAAKWFLTPALTAGKVGLKLFGFGSNYIAKTLTRFAGSDTLKELATFMIALSGLNEGFRQRAKETKSLLQSPTTAFVLVTGPMPDRVDEAVYFHRLLKEHALHVAAIIVNRVHREVPESCFANANTLAEPLKGKMLQTLKEMKTLAEADAVGIEQIKEGCQGTPLWIIPRFERDVHDLTGLHKTAEFLFD